jgi:phospholipid/cholesterol/gamma-HCH transport system ATP-binding protein
VSVLAPPVLEFADARLPFTEQQRASGASAPLKFSLAAGGLAVIDPQGSALAALLADAAVGLVRPIAGRVLFQGQDWQAMTPAQAIAARARIGHCFIGGGWLPHLSVLDNLTLAGRYHGGVPARALTLQAATLAVRFGLPGVPTGLPGEVSPPDLARAALVRAFLGRPALILLEEPRRDLPDDITPALVQAIRRARDRGAGVLWLTRGEALMDPALPADTRLRLAGGRLLRVSADPTLAGGRAA